MTVVPPEVPVQVASRIETPVETKSKHFSNLAGGRE
ncbi:hypothetical protein ABID50_001908 [Streptococcus parasuis]|uniref:Uncharacterized protein n=1 Tax=Streptococcus parasuis TaxID=1501662 RepID=A0ABV2EUG8_9STRE